MISFRIDWLGLFAVQGTLKSLLQHHSSKASILWRSAFFTVQHSHPYMTTGNTIGLTRRTFVGKVLSLLFNMLSRLVITFQYRIAQIFTLNLNSTNLLWFMRLQTVGHNWATELNWTSTELIILNSWGKVQTSVSHTRKTSTSALLITPKPLTV